MAITARKLRRLEAWSTWRAAGGTRQAVVDDAIVCRASATIESEQLIVGLPLDSPAAGSLGARKVIAVDQSDARINLLVRSDSPGSTGWTRRGAAVVTGKPDPLGGTRAVEVTLGALGVADLYQTVPGLVSGNPYWASFWIKVISRGTGALRAWNPDQGALKVDFTPSVDGEWIRFKDFLIPAYTTNNGGIGWQSVDGSTWTVQFFGAQLEPNRTTDYMSSGATQATVDAVFDEYRILDRTVDDQAGMINITAAPFRLTDLQGAGLISSKDADNVIVYDFEVLGQTPTDLINNYILPALAAAGFGWVGIGTITPTARTDITFSWDTPLGALIRIASANTCELDLRKTPTGYVIDIVPKVNSSAQRADLRVDKNLVNVTRSESSLEQATRIYPKGATQDELAGTMARAAWQVSALNVIANAGKSSRDLTGTGWTTSGVVTRTQNAIGLDGTANSATTVADADATAIGIIGQSVGVPVDTNTHAISFYVRKDNDVSRFPLLYAFIGGGTAVTRGVYLNTKTGQIQVGFTSGVGTHRLVDGATLGLPDWWIVEITITNNGTAGNTGLNAQVYPARGNVFGVDNVAATGSIVVGQVQFNTNRSSFTAPIFTTGAAGNGTEVTLIDAAGGVGPIQFVGQLLWRYLRKVDGTLTQVSGSTTSGVVTVQGSTGLAVGDLIQFRADSSGSDLTFLEDPAAVYAYGIKSAVTEVTDVPATNNLVKNSVMRDWPGGAGSTPTNWSAVNAPTIAKQTAAPFTAIGGQSIKVTSTTDGQGVVSDAVPIFPTAANPFLSGFAKVWVASGNARVELLINTPSGQKVFPALPDVATPSVAGQWADVGESGFDANGVAATTAQIRIVQHGNTASVFYIDAAQITQTATQQPFFEGSGGTRLWQEANAALIAGSNPVVSLTVPLVDLETYDPTTWSESALILGANTRVVDPRLSLDVITRIVGIERDYLNPQSISVTLSNKYQDLTEVLADTQSARPERDPGGTEDPLTIPQQPKITASFDVNGQLIINSFGDNDVVSQKLAWATGSAPSSATVRAASAINQQNISGLATGNTYLQGVTVFIAAYAYNAKGFESQPLAVVSVSRQGAIIDYTPFASSLTPIKLVSALPGSGAFVGETVFLTTTKKLYTWDGSAWHLTVDAVDISGQIQTAQIADAAITALKIGALAVTAGKIAASAVGSTELAALAVTNAKIAANAVDTGKLAASAVTTNELAALAVTGAKIAAATITAANIAANTITAAQIAALTITSAQIATGTITAANIASGAITAGKISVGTGGAALNSDPNTSDITAWDNIGANAGSIVTLTDGKVGPTALRSVGYSAYESHRQPYDPAKAYRVRGWVRRDGTSNGGLYLGIGVFDHSGAFANGSNYNYIAASNAVPTANVWTEYQGVLGANQSWVTTPEKMSIVLLLDYPGGSVGYYEAQDVRLEEVLPGTLIMDGAIVTNKLAANAVTAGKIAADTITASEIAAGAITSSELAANSVIAGKIAALSITAAEIAALTITGAKIAAGTITADKLVANSITAGQIQAGAIGTTELAAGAVTAAKIAAGTITANEIAAGTLTVDKLVVNNLVDACFVVGDGVAHSIASSSSASYDWATTAVVDTTGNMHNGNGFPAAIVVRRTGGIVFIIAQVDWDGNTVGARQLDITKNDTSVIMSDLSDAAGIKDFWQTVIAVDYNPSNGDYYRVQVTQTSGGTRTVSYQTFRVAHLKL